MRGVQGESFPLAGVRGQRPRRLPAFPSPPDNANEGDAKEGAWERKL